MIEPDLLRANGGVEKHLKKGSTLAEEGDELFFFYQIISGQIKMNNYNEEGNETIQGIFSSGQSFAEPAIFGDFRLPANIEAIEDTHLLALEKNRLFNLLEAHPQIALNYLKILSKRLRFKAILAKEIKGHEAEHRIITLLKYLKQTDQEEGVYQVKMTRQTIANLTGLRVETVIRAIKILEEKGKLSIKKRKLYL